MAPFLKKPLKALDFIYDFVGGLAGLGEFADSAIQPVHDVSREGELGSSLGGLNQLGYSVITDTDVHVGTGVLRSTSDPYAVFDNLGVPRAQGGVWLMDAFCSCDDATDFRFSLVSIAWPTFPLFTAAQQQLIASFDLTLNDPVEADFVVGNALGNYIFSRLPLFLPDGTIVNFFTESDSTGTVTILTNVLTWAGPAGARPPGVS